MMFDSPEAASKMGIDRPVESRSMWAAIRWQNLSLGCES
jgi:hypothetical protein